MRYCIPLRIVPSCRRSTPQLIRNERECGGQVDRWRGCSRSDVCSVDDIGSFGSGYFLEEEITDKLRVIDGRLWGQKACSDIIMCWFDALLVYILWAIS